jgi:hypothetical protein
MLLVSGRNRVPNPPAMMTAFMRAFNSWMKTNFFLGMKSYAKKDTAASSSNSQQKTKSFFDIKI